MEEKIIMQPAEQTAPADAADIDRRIQEAIEKARAEWERAQAETRRIAAMTTEERAGYELSRREAELAEREKKLNERELKAMAIEKLAQRGLPRELADALPYDSEAACLNGIDRLERVFREAVQKSVDQRLRGETPASGAVRGMDAESMSDGDYYQAALGGNRFRA